MFQTSPYQSENWSLFIKRKFCIKIAIDQDFTSLCATSLWATEKIRELSSKIECCTSVFFFFPSKIMLNLSEIILSKWTPFYVPKCGQIIPMIIWLKQQLFLPDTIEMPPSVVNVTSLQIWQVAENSLDFTHAA